MRVPRGGPSGGNGGHGGSVNVVASAHTNTLINYRFHPELTAERGDHGQGSNRTGRGGADLDLAVPIGTLVYEQAADDPPGEHTVWTLLADLAEEGQRVLVARGGRGGLGNAHFATSTNRAPRKVQPGEPGEEKRLRLELKLLADVGLVGYPNAGKSTLVSRISAARPKIADYPFTTLTPNLGVVGLSGDRSFVVADVPGLIEGAHRGLGLGHQFLRHLERTKVLVHLVDVSGASGRDPAEDLDTLRRELELFRPELAAKPQLVAANKIDAMDRRWTMGRVDREARSARAKALGLPFFKISGVTGAGVPELLEAAWQRLAPTPPNSGRASDAHERETMSRRIGILGGTFDPIHCGHVDIGAAAHSALGLTRLFVIPANIPPHRPQPFASSFHRFAMVALAVAGNAGWRASDLELRVESASYTSTTLRCFLEGGYAPSELFFVAGADTFVEIGTWKDYPQILDLAHFAVVSRPGRSVDDLPDRLPLLASRMARPPLDRTRHLGTLIFLIDAPTTDVSSTAIRQRCGEGLPITGLVTVGVQQHIEQHGLYASNVPGRRGSRPNAGPGGRQVAWRKLKKRKVTNIARRPVSPGDRPCHRGGRRQEGRERRGARSAEGGRVHRFFPDLFGNQPPSDSRHR